MAFKIYNMLTTCEVEKFINYTFIKFDLFPF